MSKLTRRYFLLSAAALPVACALRRPGANGPTPNAASVREPSAGQSWRYAKRDAISGAFVDNQIDTVNTVGTTVSIDSRSEAAAYDEQAHSWGMAWLHKNFGEHRPSVSLASEIQEPWGMILVDPHWSEIQVFEAPIPLWPTQLRPGWHSHFNARYKTPSHEGAGLGWDQTISAHDWETITVPAGQFSALRYTNLINFTSADFARTTSIRRESIWFAPQVGRWVARESIGTYYLTDSVSDQPYMEPSFRWELLEWT
jgi:hypothetical protein